MIKEKTIKIQDGDNTLAFKIRTMGAIQGAEWIAKAGFLVAKKPDMFQSVLSIAAAPVSGAQATTPPGIKDGASEAYQNADTGDNGDQVMVVIMLLAMNSEYKEARPLFMELLACCSRVDAGVEQVCTPETVDAFIQDPMTIFQLIREAGAWNFSSLKGGKRSSPPAEESDQAKPRPAMKTIKTSRG